jgi:predicted dehydrogenase
VVTTLCDVDLNVVGRAQKILEEAGAPKPKVVQDIRRVLDDNDIDIVSIATPDHWHALGAIWACQAGKDVYVEKPVSHNVSEGRRIVEAARKYDRVVQTGTQGRSSPAMREAIKFIHDGGIGKVYMAKGLCYKRRKSIGHTPNAPVPEGVDYDLWLGPAPERPFSRNRFHYNWHWIWDYGTTDMGNQGVHQMDIARWGINKHELPTKIHGTGNMFVYDDDQETPNTQLTTFEYDDTLLVFEVRGLFTNDEKEVTVGNIFYGSDGYLTIGRGGWQAYLGEKGEPGPGSSKDGPRVSHFQNFIDAVRNRDRSLLNADILEGHLSSALCHLGNISYRTGRKLTFDPAWENFPGDDEANSYLTRRYRKPFVVPERV